VRGEKVRGWWPLVSIASVLVAASWVLYVVWRSPHRSDLATYGAFAVAVATLIAAWVAWAWRARTGLAGPAAAGLDVDRVADLLAIAVKTQWERAAGERGLVAEAIPVTWGRPSLPLAGPVAAAAASRRFAPLPGLTPAREAQLVAGDIGNLHAVYGGLRSGRLVIAGAAGSGKSGAAVLLVLAALKHRDQVRTEERGKVPVPVLFTAQNWDPRREPVKQWLTGRLQQTYPLFAGRTGAANAGGLIDAGKITVILDGLDEIGEELRPVALQALNQASFRVVVLSRTAEMASAASLRGVLQGAAAVELRVVDAATAADYLERVQLDPPPEGWHELINRIRANPANPLAEALNNPLALTLIRDTYQSGDDARELLRRCDTIQQRVSGVQAAEEITDHLLDRVLPAAYAPQPGQPLPRYDVQTAQNALAKIAARMNQDNTRDLQWWRIPRWAPSAQRIIAGGLLAWLVFGLPVGLVFWFISGFGNGVTAAIYLGLLAGVAVGVATGLTSGPPARIGRIRRPRLSQVFTKRNLKFGLLSGLVICLLYDLGSGLEGARYGFGFVPGLRQGLVQGVALGLAFAFVSGLAIGLANAFVDLDNTSSPSPATSWRNDRAHSMTIGLVVGLVIGLIAGLAIGLPDGLQDGVASGLEIGILIGFILFGLVSGLIAGLGVSHAWPTTLAAAQLAMHWRTPLHLMNFLDDARERNVLRTVGPVYQFRHARLQDRMSVTTNGSPPTLTLKRQSKYRQRQKNNDA
jgi:hypothetical protein